MSLSSWRSSWEDKIEFYWLSLYEASALKVHSHISVQFRSISSLQSQLQFSVHFLYIHISVRYIYYQSDYTNPILSNIFSVYRQKITSLKKSISALQFSFRFNWSSTVTSTLLYLILIYFHIHIFPFSTNSVTDHIFSITQIFQDRRQKNCF